MLAAVECHAVAANGEGYSNTFSSLVGHSFRYLHTRASSLASGMEYFF